jgi:hypothetical protein
MRSKGRKTEKRNNIKSTNTDISKTKVLKPGARYKKNSINPKSKKIEKNEITKIDKP